MTKQHLKRIAMPGTWQVKRKGIKFITRPNSGAHKLQEGMPLNVMLKNILGIETTKEAKAIANSGDVLVDGKSRPDYRYITGIFDTLSFPKTKKHYRVILNKNAKIDIVEINEKESKIKPCKIVGKTIIKGNMVQLNLSGGINAIVAKDEYKTGDTLVIEVPEKNIKEHLSMKKGCFIFLTGGKHAGAMGNVDEVARTKIAMTTTDGKKFETLTKYAFVVGKQKPSFTLTA